ncbi:MAG: PorV/PorQ family protein [Rhizobacter sp.]|nr:PorV/PorQ family protein [Chlorobiales bacterium]
MFKKTLLFALLVALPAPVRAQTGLSFLKLGPSAREQAMGDVGAASASGAAANYYNAAMLSAGGTSAVMFSHSPWLRDTRSNYFAANFRGEQSAIGVSLSWLTVADIPVRTAPTLDPEGSFTSQSAALSVSYARKFSSVLTLALTGKVLYEKIYINDARGFAVDLSAAATPFGEPLTLAAALQNLGGFGSLSEEAVKLPTTLRLGAAYTLPLASLQSALTLEANGKTIFSDATEFGVGAEFAFNGFLWGRLGLTAGNESRGVSAGAGVAVNGFKIDFAFVPFSNSLGSATVFTLQYLY